MIKTYFDQEIQLVLLQIINRSKQDLTAAIAWFTDPAVFAALSGAIDRGVKLKLLTQDDEINRNAPFELEELVRKGAQVWKWDPALLGTMHHKFLIVDRHIVMAGSYNWTLSAANRNRENVIVFDGDDSPVKDYLAVFEDICRQAFPQSKMAGSDEISYSDIKAKIRVRIRQAEAEVGLLEAEKAEAEAVIDRFSVQLQQRLGDLILKRAETDTKLARLKAEVTKKRSDFDRYNQKQSEYEASFHAYQQDKGRENPHLSEEDELSLRKMHREAVMFIHPDRFFDQPDLEIKAHEITVILNEAYKNKDIEKVKQIWQSVQDGTIFGIDIANIDEVDRLEEILKKLEYKLELLKGEITDLKYKEFYRVGIDPDRWEEYFDKLSLQLAANIKALENEIELLSDLKRG